MKHLFTTVITLLLSLSCLHAQRIYFTDTSNKWLMSSSFPNEETFESDFFTYTYCIRDTILDGETWSYFAYRSGELVDPGNGLLVREDTAERRVYARTRSITDSSGFATFILYDFNMEAGDTLQLQSDYYSDKTYICDTVYPDVLINDLSYRAFRIHEIESACPFMIIEGIGSLNGPLELFQGCGEYPVDLVCFDNDGEPDAIGWLQINDCFLSIAEKDIIKPIVSLAPNPVFNILHISLSEPGSSLKIAIHNVLGKRIYEGQIKSKMDLDISIWPSGVYILRISDNKGNSAADRFVKQ